MFFLIFLGAVPYHVETLIPDERVIILKTGQPSQIKEEHHKMCPAGEVTFRFPKLPYQLEEDSLLVQVKGKHDGVGILNKRFESLKLDFRNFLIQSFGKEINLVSTNPAGEEVYKPVILLNIDSKNHPTVFSKGVIEFNPPGRIAFPKESFAFFPSLSVSFLNPSAQVCTCSLNYICPLFFWRAFYNAEVDLKESKVAFQGTLKVHNLTGIPFSQTTLLWMPSWGKNSNSIPEKLSDNVSIPNGMYHSFGFFSQVSKLSFSYHIDLPLEGGEGDKVSAQKRIALKDVDLARIPDGILHVYLRRKHDTVHIANHMLKKFSKEHLELILDKEPKLVLNIKTLQTRAVGDTQKEVTHYVEITNESNTALSLRLSLYLPKNYGFVSAYQDPQGETQSSLYWTMTVPAQEKRAFWYRILSPVPSS